MFPLLFLVCTAIFEADLVAVRRIHGVQWTEGKVPYEIRSPLASWEKGVIETAMRIIESVTCVRFLHTFNDTDYIYFERTPRWPTQEYMMKLGNNGGAQGVFVNIFSTYITMVHILMHVLGFGHEHNRPDRDKYVEIMRDCLRDYARLLYNKDPNAETYNLPYDYWSIMHASSRADILIPSLLCKGGLTMKRKGEEGLKAMAMGQREKLTCNDIWKINLHYNCTEQLTSYQHSNYLYRSCPPCQFIGNNLGALKCVMI